MSLFTALLKKRLSKIEAANAARNHVGPKLTGAAPRMYTNDDRSASVEIGSAEWRSYMLDHGEDIPPAE